MKFKESVREILKRLKVNVIIGIWLLHFLVVPSNHFSSVGHQIEIKFQKVIRDRWVVHLANLIKDHILFTNRKSLQNWSAGSSVS